MELSAWNSEVACAAGGGSDIMRVMKENRIVVYQPNETVRLEVELRDESIWQPLAVIREIGYTMNHLLAQK